MKNNTVCIDIANILRRALLFNLCQVYWSVALTALNGFFLFSVYHLENDSQILRLDLFIQTVLWHYRLSQSNLRK